MAGMELLVVVDLDIEVVYVVDLAAVAAVAAVAVVDREVPDMVDLDVDVVGMELLAVADFHVVVVVGVELLVVADVDEAVVVGMVPLALVD